VATIVFLAGVAGWLVVLWRSWGLFVALEALWGQGRPASSLLVTSAARTLHVDQVFHSTIIGFFLALAAWRWFPALERQTEDPSRVRVLRWATVGLIVAIIVATAPARRLVWDPFEVASFENERALVIGRRGDELLLYYPNREGVKYRRVPRDAPMLNRTGVTAFIFDRQ
jgi:hypothetical protein